MSRNCILYVILATMCNASGGAGGGGIQVFRKAVEVGVLNFSE